jgi:hypothetical protein
MRLVFALVGSLFALASLGPACLLFGAAVPCAVDGDCPLGQSCDLDDAVCVAGTAADDAGVAVGDDGGSPGDDAGPDSDGGEVDGGGDTDGGVDGGPDETGFPLPRCTPPPSGVVVQPGPFFDQDAPEKRELGNTDNSEELRALAAWGEEVVAGGTINADLLVPGTAADILVEASGNDAFVARFTEDGLARWAFAAGSSVSSFGEAITDVVVDDDGCLYVAGTVGGGILQLPGCDDLSEGHSFDDHAFVAHIDIDDGSCVWAAELRGWDDGRTQRVGEPVIAAAPGGGVVLAATVDEGAEVVDALGAPFAQLGDTDTEDDLALVRLSSRGRVVWSKLYGGDAGRVEPRDVVTTDDSLVLCADAEALSVDLGGPSALTIGTDSAVLARYTLASGDYAAATAIGVDSGGNASSCRELVRDADRLVVSGTFDGTLFTATSQGDDLFLASVDLALDAVAPIGTYGVGGDEEPTGLAVAGDGHILVSANVRTYSFVIGGFTLDGDSSLPDPVVFDVDASGTVTSARRYVGDNNTYVTDLAHTRGGRVYVVGDFIGEVDVEGEIYTANDLTIATDVFFVRYGP